ncbi:hypothetical protein HMPREF1557_01674 [Streptococcus sobrinus W1703]|uniref:Uncharacterized protein n=1 Tax=Streptococcus sobrinus W1703 TaxID=1227275 RepID=U2J3N9_9STRE|nr:hypothetical protein HMPREF1557_01674 [Streptococcus sobrinus W1703]
MQILAKKFKKRQISIYYSDFALKFQGRFLLLFPVYSIIKTECEVIL